MCNHRFKCKTMDLLRSATKIVGGVFAKPIISGKLSVTKQKLKKNGLTVSRSLNLNHRFSESHSCRFAKKFENSGTVIMIGQT